MTRTAVAPTPTKTDPSKRDRNATLDGVRFSEDERTVTFPLSSETPYRRYYWSVGQELDEILSHEKAAVDLSFLNSGNAPVLDTHSRNSLAKQIGVIKKAWIEGERVYVECLLSGRDDAAGLVGDIREGIIRNVSVGYEITRFEIDEDKGTYTATRWMPKEASFVPLPADSTVGIGRSIADHERINNMPPAQPLPGLGAPIDAVTDEERAEKFVKSVDEITALASEHNMGDVARDYIKGVLQTGGEPSLAFFKGIVKLKLPEGTPLVNNTIGLSEKEKRSFSVLNLMRTLEDPTFTGAGLELEASNAARDKLENTPAHGGRTLPADLMNTWGTFTINGRTHDARQNSRAAIATGGHPNVLAVDHLAASFIENLRNRSAILQAGATMLDGLSSNVEIPGGDQNIGAAWLGSEDADAAESTPTFRKITLAPKDIATFTDVTRRMLQQSTISMEAYVRAQIVAAIVLGIDTAALYGSGASGVPEGIANTTGIGSQTFAAAIPTRDEIIDLRTDVAVTNAGRGVTYLGNSQMVGDLQKTKVDAGSGIFLMGDAADRLVGNAYNESNQVTDGDLIAGVWPELLIGMWDGLQLDVSTEAKFLSGGLRYRAIQTVDTAVRRVGSFSMGNDGV